MFVFKLSQAAALKLDLIYHNTSVGSSSGDVYVTNRAYKVMIDTLLRKGNYATDFNSLCSGVKVRHILFLFDVHSWLF